MTLALLPNLICVLRIALTVPIVWLLIERAFGLTLLLFLIAAVSDGLDGWLAKTFGWTSEAGKVLDPLADKLLLVSLFVALALVGLVPAWLAVLVVARDVIIGVGAGVFRWLFGPLDGRPTWASKLNTLVQLLFVVAVVGHQAYPAAPDWPVLALGALVLVTTVISGYDYTAIYVRRAAAVSRARRAAA